FPNGLAPPWHQVRRLTRPPWPCAYEVLPSAAGRILVDAPPASSPSACVATSAIGLSRREGLKPRPLASTARAARFRGAYDPTTPTARVRAVAKATYRRHAGGNRNKINANARHLVPRRASFPQMRNLLRVSSPSRPYRPRAWPALPVFPSA